jgi:hypothetical protein
MNIPKELQELRANTEELVKKYKEIKALSPENSHESDKRISDIEDIIFRMVSYIHTRINNLEDGFYQWMWDHAGFQSGHLPPIKGAEKMENALKVLGLDKDYDVKKPMVMAASTQYGLEIVK